LRFVSVEECRLLVLRTLVVRVLSLEAHSCEGKLGVKRMGFGALMALEEEGCLARRVVDGWRVTDLVRILSQHELILLVQCWCVMHCITNDVL